MFYQRLIHLIHIAVPRPLINMVMKPKNQPDSSSEEEDEVTDDEIEKMDGLMASSSEEEDSDAEDAHEDSVKGE